MVVLCFRYLLENLTEQEILTIDRQADVANCSITSYICAPGAEPRGMQLERYNFVTPIRAAGETVTAEEDVPVAPK